tara:strand:+ start:23 stop:196 length:174 start_codon:yes stop_codon:yes gene_type:complete
MNISELQKAINEINLVLQEDLKILQKEVLTEIEYETQKSDSKKIQDIYTDINTSLNS